MTDDLLRETYLAPKPVAPPLASILADRPAPWSESLAAAPDQTQEAVETGLCMIARATPHLDPGEIDPSHLPAGRARAHLEALTGVWRDLGVLPGPLSLWAHVLKCDRSEALEPLPLLEPVECPFADAAETALARTLARHHGRAAGSALPDRSGCPSAASGAAGTALHHIQSHLGREVSKTGQDASIACFGLRDPREEAEFAAARARRMLDDGTVADPRDIGLLLPDESAYALATREVFDRIGLPVSGQLKQGAERDTAGEILSLLLVLLRGAAPRTALASLFIDPAMPWPPETGRRMARETMDRGWSRTASELGGAGRAVLDALRPCETPDQLFAALGKVAKATPAADLYPRIVALRAVTPDALDWPVLQKLAAPRPIPATERDRFVEGISLFSETALPWRSVRQLIVAGLSGRRWPRPVAANPFFTEDEIRMLREEAGLRIAGRREQMARGLELFRRQLCTATEGLTLLAPACDLRGGRLTASTGLALIAHTLGAGTPAALLRDVRADPSEAWPVCAETPRGLPTGGTPILPAEGLVRIQRGLSTPDQPGVDLLRLREAEDGTPAPQSPSRLETLLVSPLAWLLDELGAKDRTWAPDALDVMTLGSILHRVLELVFTENRPAPDPEALQSSVPGSVDAAILRYARWLADPQWTMERQTLEREALGICLAWREFLMRSGAEILHNEIELDGDFGGLLLTGKADCLLRLSDGRLMIVDHKRSRARSRRDRFAKGWDLQVALYRAMLERSGSETVVSRRIAQGARVVTAYHTMLDAVILTDPEGAGLPGVEAAPGDPSVKAMAHLAQTLAEVGAGTVRLNRAGDLRTFEKERGITAYALKDNPFVAAFTLPEADTLPEGDD